MAGSVLVLTDDEIRIEGRTNWLEMPVPEDEAEVLVLFSAALFSCDSGTVIFVSHPLESPRCENSLELVD